MFSTSRSSALIWPFFGLLLGGGCGWAWRSADLPSGVEVAVVQPPPLPVVSKIPIRDSQKKPNDSEAPLRAAIRANRAEDIHKWVVEVAKQHGALALKLLLDWKSPQRDEMLGHAIYHAAIHDPEGTAKLIFATPEMRSKDGRVARLFEGITRGKVELTLKMLPTLAPEYANSALRGIAREWARVDWRSALDHGMGMQDLETREIFLKEALGIQLKQGFGQLAAWMQTLSPSTRQQLPIDWQQVNFQTPKEFAQLMELHPSALKGYQAGPHFDRLMKVTDATAATRDWIDSLPPGDARDRAYEAYVIRSAQQQPDSTNRLLDEVTSPAERARLSSTLAGLSAYENPQAALTFANALPDPGARAAARVTVMGVVGLQSPQLGAVMLISSEAQWSPEDMRTLAVIYSYNAPLVTLKAGLRMKNATNRQRWMEQGLIWWLQRDVTSASTWAMELQEGPLKDQAFSAVSQRLAGNSPETAIGWAEAITTPKKRMEAIENVMYNWIRLAPEGWDAWLANSKEDLATQQSLREKSSRVRRTQFYSSTSDGSTIIFSP